MSYFKKTQKAHADYSTSAMETGDHLKNGASLKSHTSKGNKYLFLLCALLFFTIYSNGIYAQQQQKTAYEKKIVEITQKYFKILFGYNKQLSMTEKMQLDMITDGESARDFILGIGILGYATNHSEAEVKRMVLQIENELKQAEKLKTAVDFKREQDAKAREEEKKKKANQEAYERTDVGSIQKNIKSAFEKWNQKGEFEKEADYAERLPAKSQTVFENICIEKINNRIESKNNNYWEKKLSPYNSESELFTVSFKIDGVEGQSKINIPIAQAENFKNNWSDLKFKTDNYDWCFVENSLCPTLITLENKNNKYEFNLSLQNQSEIICYFDDLEIDNPHLKGFIFKYSDAREIALKEIALYNNKLDSVFQNYNRQLLDNPYNIEKTVISDYKKVSMGKNKEDNYKSSLNSLKDDYDKTKNNLERVFNSAYFDAKQFFSTKEEFEKFYTQGKDVLQEEIAKRKEKQEEEKVLKLLKDQSKSIESIDFQKYTLAVINECKNKSYYPQIIDLVIETNKGLNKEWTKNGQYFENKIVFYDSYVSGSYDKILKDNKKKK